MLEHEDSEESNDDDFDAAFNEAAGIEVEETVTAVPELEDEMEQEPPEKEEPQQQEQEAPGTEEEAETGRIAELEADLAIARHAAESEKGRVRALNLKLEEAVKKPPVVNSDDDDMDDDTLEDKSQEDDFENDYPEVSKLIKQQVDARVKPLEAQADAEKLRQQEVQDQTDEENKTQAVEDFYRGVAKTHPDFNEVKSSPEFLGWYQDQTPEVQRMANSWDAKNGVAIINMYKSTISAPPGPTDKTELLDDMVDIPRKGGARASSAADDFDSAFTKAAAKYDV